MGLERTIHTPSIPLEWPKLVERLKDLGETPILRMIDGLPAFPDETPADDWRELRLGLCGGMVTLRRTLDGYSCVTWGTDDSALGRSCDVFVQSVAEITGGRASP